MMVRKPIFIIKENAQKTKGHFRNILSREVLKDICIKVTGRSDFICYFKSNNYGDKYFDKGKWNVGRMAILKYDNNIAYIALSMPDCEDSSKTGRNSAIESVGVLYNRFYMDKDDKKKLFYYFVGKKGLTTPYLQFHYRVFKTIGFEFLNDQEMIGNKVQEFTTVEDVIASKNVVTKRARNKKNNPTFVTQNENNIVQIYGKTFGAHKYETSMLCYMLSKLNKLNKVELYEISDNGLSSLPKPSQDIIIQLKNIVICNTSITLEKKGFTEKENLRSPIFTYNLLEGKGSKKCALCGCVVPQLIQGAHIWPVASIRKRADLTSDQKFEYAIDGENGVWLCENHHKLFDANLMMFSNNGKVSFMTSLNSEEKEFVEKITENKMLPSSYVTPNFMFYIDRRYEI